MPTPRRMPRCAPQFAVSEEEAETLHSKGDVCIGALAGKYAFDGFIDECRIWDECRAEEQVKQYMNAPACEPTTPHLLGQWTFNEGHGEMVVDSSGLRNHGSFDRYGGGVEMRRVMSRKPLSAHPLLRSNQELGIARCPACGAQRPTWPRGRRPVPSPRWPAANTADALVVVRARRVLVGWARCRWAARVLRVAAVEPEKTEREKHIEANYNKLLEWKNEFEARNGRQPSKADMLLAEPEITALARRLGELF